MSKNSVTIQKQPGTSTLVRPKFGPGMLLQHEDLGALNDYTRELSRLMFRSLFGCGVICGLVVNADVDNCNKVFVTVGAGLALDCSGDPVYVPKDQRFVLDENCFPDLPDKLWVVLCGTTKNCAPRTSMCTDDDDKSTSVCTRERDMFEIRVVSARPTCACGCAEPSTATGDPTYIAPKGSAEQQGSNDPCLCADPTLDCHADHYAGKCGCSCGDGSDCGCECILLARLEKSVNSEKPWTVDHGVRRFIRPVLMRDPQVEMEELVRKEAQSQSAFYKRSQQVEKVETALEEASPAPVEDPGTVEQIQTMTKRQRKTKSQRSEPMGS
jgi:hypothetical protein